MSTVRQVSGRMRRPILIAGIGVSCLLGGLGAGAFGLSATASVDSPSVAPDDAPGWAVYSALESQPGFVDGGLSNDGSVEVSWEGTPSAEAALIISEAEAAGLTVVVHSVAIGPDQFWADATSLAARLESEGLVVGGFGSNRTFETMELLGPEISSDPTVQNQVSTIVSEMFGDRYELVFLPEGQDVAY